MLMYDNQSPQIWMVGVQQNISSVKRQASIFFIQFSSIYLKSSMSLPKDESFDQHEESFQHQAQSENNSQHIKQQSLHSQSNLTKKGYISICVLILILALAFLIAPAHDQKEPIAVQESVVELQGNSQASKSISANTGTVVALQKSILKGQCILQPNINLSVESLYQNDRLGGHIRKHVDCYDPKSKKQVTSCFSSWNQFKNIYVSFSQDTCFPEEVDVRNNVMKEHSLSFVQPGYIKKYGGQAKSCNFRTVKIVYKLIESAGKYYWIVLTAYPSDCS